MTEIKIHLIGAGPGDPGLITVRGLSLLRSAEALVYDALVSQSLVAEAPPSAQMHFVGKRGGQPSKTQDEINQLLLDLAQQGLRVVRLKGGDPYLFGRGAEEAAFLARHSVACEIVPGVTSGLAAPAYAGIPVTHRQIASTVTLVTGHEDPAKEQQVVNYRALGQLIAAGGTVCFYMGVSRLPRIVAALTDGGLDIATPAAVVQWGTTPRQRCVRAPLGQLQDAVQREGIGSPAIIVVGQVTAIDEPGLDAFMRRPLFGQRILTTRTRHQASDLRKQLEAQGAAVLEAPTIELVEPDDWTPIDDAIRKLGDFDWLILTSVNGVEALAQRMAGLQLDGRHLAGVKLAAIGRSVVASLQSLLGIRADLVPTEFVAESLAADLMAKQDVAGKRFLLLRADLARPTLPRQLAAAGAEVVDLPVYHTRIAAGLPDEVLEALRRHEVDWVTFTSSSTATNLVQLLGDERSLLGHVRIASIGPVTSQTLCELGLPVACEAQQHDIPGLVRAIADHACKAV